MHSSVSSTEEAIVLSNEFSLPLCGPSQEKVKQDSAPEPPCPAVDSRLTSSLLKIARLLDEGTVCGIPTDTVYALAASCKNPQAIEKIYNIKVRKKKKDHEKLIKIIFVVKLTDLPSVTSSRTDQQRSLSVFASPVWSSWWQQSLPLVLCSGSS